MQIRDLDPAMYDALNSALMATPREYRADVLDHVEAHLARVEAVTAEKLGNWIRYATERYLPREQRRAVAAGRRR